MLLPCNEKCYFASFCYGFGCAIWQEACKEQVSHFFLLEKMNIERLCVIISITSDSDFVERQ